jgi:hypothetical protein
LISFILEFLSNRGQGTGSFLLLDYLHLDRRTDSPAIVNRKAHWGYRFSFGAAPFLPLLTIVVELYQQEPPITHEPQSKVPTIHDGITESSPRQYRIVIITADDRIVLLFPPLDPEVPQPRRQI